VSASDVSPSDGAGLEVFTVGHSNHTLDEFVDLLRQHAIEVVVDVRSAPYSRYSSHFNRDQLKAALRLVEIQYVFQGDTLGGRPPGDEFYDDEGHVRYDRTSEAPFFQEGLERLCDGARHYRVAMMCSEGKPHECHRHLLNARVLSERGVNVNHILPDGTLVVESDIPRPVQTPSLFEPEEEQWRSVRSVLPNTEPASSSGNSAPQASID
jgi:uncharacterized protein (DUF488 family)